MKRLDRVAGSVARQLLRWVASGRGQELTWVRALGSELDEIATGWSQLRWALGAVRLRWIESSPARRHRWHIRLRWIESAGGLGGLHVYGPAVAGGIGMSLWVYANRGADAPLPLAAAVLAGPYFAVIGFCWARRRTAPIAAAVGAITAVVGFEVVTIGTAVYTVVTESFPNATLWVGFGIGYVLPVGFVGAITGLAGAIAAHPISSIRAIRRAIVESQED
ncbi:hypothetical protein [Amycolatopsis balhimycina]|uniref:hypothetical protein n=1 Tax=Amycolatopsis balhimycina TaxID=208443 RepID=UPI000F7A9AF0|nr:hypothetical protein [Amycolatopsis balhimycina]